MLGAVPADYWERKMYEQLQQQLPSDCVVIPNVGWSTYGPSSDFRYVRDGQADFVVVVPGMGMVIVEVKGSARFRIADDGRWYRTDARTGLEIVLEESPAAQATRNMHELRSAVERKGGYERFPGLFGYVVAYPQGRLVSAPPALHDSSTLIVASQMHELTARLRHALAERGSPEVAARCDAVAVERITQILTSSALEISKADTPTDVAVDARSIDVLTRQQFAALQGVFGLPRVAVVGPAGSGKTVLAMWRLAALVESGRRALYVCYNKTLAAALQRREPMLSDSIRHIDSLFRRMVESAGKLPRVPTIEREQTAFFREQLPGLAMDVASTWSREERYDAIIVDEGQDFSELQLIALLELIKPDSGSYVLFADRRQDVYQASTIGAVGAEVMFSLYHNCRNTSRINDLTNRLTSSSVLPMPGVPQGVEPMTDHCASAQLMASRAWQLAHAWRVPGERVAILSPWVLERSAMQNSPRGHGLRLVTSLEEWEQPETVYFSTIKAFKGIEATSVIVVDVQVLGAHVGFREEDLYVACTRATSRLALLTHSREACEWMLAARL